MSGFFKGGTGATVNRTTAGMNSPLGGFTVVGGIVVIVLLLMFIRSKIVVAFLGFLVLAFLLIHVKQILPAIFNKQISDSYLRGI